MKRIVKGKAYNTETAERVGSWDNGYFTTDFNYCSEDLYRKRTGEFFLHGEGHAMSIYASHEGNSSGWGEQIIPLTYQEAQEWAEKHLTGDEYEEIFGEVSEDDSRVSMNLSMTTAEAEIIKRNAAQEGMTVSAYIVMRCTE